MLVQQRERERERLLASVAGSSVPSVLGYDYIGARTDTTQQSGQTPDKEAEIKNITGYVSGYTETDTTGILSPPIVGLFSVAADIDSNVFDYYFLIWSLSRLLCCVGSGFNVAAATGTGGGDWFSVFRYCFRNWLKYRRYSRKFCRMQSIHS